MLVKINLGNVKILNKETIIEQLQKGYDKISLILEPTWYAEYAIIGNLLNDNDPRQNYQIFLKGNGEFSIDLELDEPVVYEE